MIHTLKTAVLNLTLGAWIVPQDSRWYLVKGRARVGIEPRIVKALQHGRVIAVDDQGRYRLRHPLPPMGA